MTRIYLLLTFLLACFSAASVVANGPKSACTPKQQSPCPPVLDCPPYDCPEPEPCPPCLFNCIEFYCGGLVGYSHTRTKVDNHLVAGAPFNIDSSRHAHKNANRVIGEGLLGARYRFPCEITGGVELAGTVADPTTRFTLGHPNNLTFTAKVTRRYCLIPSLTVGKIFCCHWHAFFKMGLGISYVNINVFNPNFGTHRKRENRQLGVVPAVGLEYAYSQNISLLATAAYEYYKKMKVEFHSPLPRVIARDTAHVKLQFINVKIGFLYRL